jgi:hypothetical protein
MYHRRIFQVCRSISLLIALIASGCQTASHRPDFLARSEEDRARGDQSACSMVDAVRMPLIKAASQVPTEPGRIQIERNVAAIMDGMKRARSYAPAARMEKRSGCENARARLRAAKAACAGSPRAQVPGLLARP